MESITIEKEVAAPIEKVWQAWTNETILATWFGPGSSTVKIHHFHPQAGKTYEIYVIESDGATHKITGTFESLTAPHQLIITWKIHDLPMDDSLITITLKETAAGTHITLVQEKLPNEMVAGLHAQGWNAAFTNLAKTLTI